MKIGFVSLGCPKNLVDSEVMLGLAEQAGHEITADAEGADVLVVNTCAFIDRAKQESIDTILEMAELKKQAAGPAAGRHRLSGRAVSRRAASRRSPRSTRCSAPARCRGFSRRSAGPAADAADPAARASRSPFYTPRSEALAGQSPSTPRFGIDLPDLSLRRRHAATAGDARALRVSQDRRRLRLQVRVLHHPEDARPLSQPHRRVDRARRRSALAARGVKELLLISQDTTFYGIDRKERGALPRLLRELERGRRPRVDPSALSLPDDDLRRGDRRDRRVREGLQVHRPAAAARARIAVLQRMKRPGTRASYEQLLARIRERIPGVTLRTTFIVGFPGETEQDFDELHGLRRRPSASITSACSPTRTRRARRRST